MSTIDTIDLDYDDLRSQARRQERRKKDQRRPTQVHEKGDRTRYSRKEKHRKNYI